MLADSDPESLTLAVCQYANDFGVTVVPTGDDSLSQRTWDEAASEVRLDGLLNSANQVHRARLLAASAPSSGAWLQVMPLPSLELLMD